MIDAAKLPTQPTVRSLYRPVDKAESCSEALGEVERVVGPITRRLAMCIAYDLIVSVKTAT